MVMLTFFVSGFLCLSYLIFLLIFIPMKCYTRHRKLYIYIYVCVCVCVCWLYCMDKMASNDFRNNQIFIIYIHTHHPRTHLDSSPPNLLGSVNIEGCDPEDLCSPDLRYTQLAPAFLWYYCPFLPIYFPLCVQGSEVRTLL